MAEPQSQGRKIYLLLRLLVDIILNNSSRHGVWSNIKKTVDTKLIVNWIVRNVKINMFEKKNNMKKKV